ncbi:hypothetical protein K437DRAFT_38315 [Tilletiaria anomala UBC 951]|uniref:Uncharacterized protein n=1 Tax=Tilletiaria anomala (strain ATCC 24038 / CBS 436.72 / UBC 951) TaxID=1037660 RepID=A0A066VFS5_TILAU|nr:uncharacterized protein K437DRAFT_38315 [Tilletiaria anomala UBC 951]KDN37410.1 hypothetical protein K437DRAFT_38315 [Tilletiaria anomala UBC 951]
MWGAFRDTVYLGLQIHSEGDAPRRLKLDCCLTILRWRETSSQPLSTHTSEQVEPCEGPAWNRKKDWSIGGIVAKNFVLPHCMHALCTTLLRGLHQIFRPPSYHPHMCVSQAEHQGPMRSCSGFKSAPVFSVYLALQHGPITLACQCELCLQ